MSRDFFDYAMFSSSRIAFDLYANAIRASIKYDIFEGQETFDVKVLTQPMSINDAMASSFFSSESIKGLLGLEIGKKTKKFVFKGRIDETISPHHFLPDPCSEAYADNPEEATKIISMHTTFVSTDASSHFTINIGDVVECRLEENVHSYNLQYGEFVGLVNSSTAAEAEAKKNQCQSLADMFASNKFVFKSVSSYSSGMPILGGSSGDGEMQTRNGIDYFRFAKSTSVLDSSVRADFDAFFNELLSKGYTGHGSHQRNPEKYPHPFITSARRSVKHQWGLYTGRFPGGMSTAPPCYSDHQYGFATDINATAPDGRSVYSKASKSYWYAIRDIAANHSIRWYGPGDEVHFYHTTSKRVLGALKKKCASYYYAKYGASTSQWPSDFADEIEYIDPPVTEAAPNESDGRPADEHKEDEETT